jgi:hypothetical protein
LHVEAVRPAIKVIMIDGIKSFASGLATGTPALRAEAVHEFTERIVNPRPAKKEPVAPSALRESKTEPREEASRARAIFDASEEAKPFSPSDFDFEMQDEEMGAESLTSSTTESSPAQSLPQAKPRSKRVLGMTPPQLAVVGTLALALLCIFVVFAYLFFSTT